MSISSLLTIRLFKDELFKTLIVVMGISRLLSIGLVQRRGA